MGCVLIVLAAVSWQANGRTWSVSTCAPVTHSGSDHLKPWCGRYGVLLIKSINGHGRAHSVPIVGLYAIRADAKRAGGMGKAEDKCTFSLSQNTKEVVFFFS